MRIVFAIEFDKQFFQWNLAWSREMQDKLQTIVNLTTVSPKILNLYSDNSAYWDDIRRADLVFVYCSRTGRKEEKEGWHWYELPLLIKKFMKPSAKMVVQFDDDLNFIFHHDWVWWGEKYDVVTDSPKDFFERTKLLEIADTYLTVLEKPLFAEYTTKPIRHLLLPQLTMVDRYTIDQYTEPWNQNYEKIHQLRNLVVMRHTSRVGSVEHTIENVIKTSGIPVTYFTCIWGFSPKDAVEYHRNNKLPNGSRVYGQVPRSEYMKILAQEGYIGIDDAEKYLGWSRFVMECAMIYIPCIGSTYAVKMLYPDLYTEPKDYAKQVELIERLMNNKMFYRVVVEKARQIMLHELDAEYLCTRLLKIADEVGCVSTVEDYEMEQFIEFLAMHGPVPSRPVVGTVYNAQYGKLTTAQWDEKFGRYAKFINDSQTYSKLHKIAVRRKNDRQNPQNKSELI